jgi:hypothetical protein
VHDVVWQGRVVHRRRLQLEVDDDERLDELRAAGQDDPVRTDDHRVAVEDQLVLPADHVEVREGAAGLGGAAAYQLQPGVVLLALVRGAVDDEEELGAGVAGLRDRAALLPEVLADRDGDVHSMHADNGEGVAGREDPVLVEDAVVGQVVLRIPADYAPVVDDRRAVLGKGPFRVGVEGALVGAVEISHDHGHRAVTVRGDVGGQPHDSATAGLHERLA